MGEAWECISYVDHILNYLTYVLLIIKLIVSDDDIEA